MTTVCQIGWIVDLEMRVGRVILANEIEQVRDLDVGRLQLMHDFDHRFSQDMDDLASLSILRLVSLACKKLAQRILVGQLAFDP